MASQDLHLMDEAVPQAERRIPAIAVSRGIGTGKVVFFEEEVRSVRRVEIASGDIASEIERLRTAKQTCSVELRKLIAANRTKSLDPLTDILEFQLLLLEQSSLLANTESYIHQHLTNAEWSLKFVSDHYSDKQSAVEDPHLREKRLDIDDLCERMLTILHGPSTLAPKTYQGAVVAVREPRPSAIIELNKCKPAGLITERGGWTSHASILAREFQIPMVSGVKPLENHISAGNHVIVDGAAGIVIVEPDRETINSYWEVTNVISLNREDLIDNTLALTTLDGERISIRANADLPSAYQRAREFGAEGIGLFRSESLISRPGRIPSEDEQFSAYRQIAEVSGAGGVTVRTFDIGIQQLHGTPSYSEGNPSLGLRSIRLSLVDQQFFKSQIRAILRASSGQNIDILLPMVSGVSEVVVARSIIDEERDGLKKRGIPVGNPGVGAMIEVPSGVFTAREIARKVDFIALGTNDLVQYLLAVDRDNDAVADWYQSLHPAVIRAIREVVQAGAESEIPVVICGEMAGSLFYVPVLIGLGARSLSMNLNSIKQIRSLVSGITLAQTTELIGMIGESETSDKTESILRAFYSHHWSHLFPSGLLDTTYR